MDPAAGGNDWRLAAMKQELKKDIRKDSQEQKTLRYILIGLFSVIVIFLLYNAFSLWVTP